MEDDSEALYRLNEEEEEEDFPSETPDSRELVVYLVDCAPSMFLSLADEVLGAEEDDEQGASHDSKPKTQYEEVMACVEEDLKARIIARDYDETALVLFNTKEKKNKMSSDGVYVVQELQPTSAGFIRDVRQLRRDSSSFGSRGTPQAAKDRESPLYNALWCAQGLFSFLGPSARNLPKRVFLFTNNDDPFGHVASPGLKADMQRTCIQRAKDAASMGVSIELFAMSRPGEEFNPNIFYKEMIQFPEEESDFMTQASGKFEDLKSQMRKQTMRKRMVRHLFLSLPPAPAPPSAGPPSRVAAEPESFSASRDTPRIALRAYALLRPSKITRSIYVNARDNAPVKVETAHICQDTGAVLSPRTCKKAQLMGSGARSTRIVLEDEDLTSLRSLAPSSLKLLGFKPLCALKDYHNLRPSTFLYPDEKSLPGSIPSFIALHKAMLKLERFALAEVSEAGMPRLAALVPQDEVKDGEEGAQVLPPGWNMIPLPFFEDIRSLREVVKREYSKHAQKRPSDAEEDAFEEGATTSIPTEEQVEKAAAVIRKMQLRSFTPLDIQNPVIQTHYAMLEAVALEEEEIALIVDSSLPNAKALSRPEVVRVVKAFKDAVFGEDFDEREAMREAAEKEKAEAAERKKRMLEDAAGARCQEIDWDELADGGKMEKLTVEDLRSYLRVHNLPLTGRKTDLIGRILCHLGRT